MDRRGDPASVKSEIDLEVSTGGSLALPRTIEFGLLDHTAQLCNKSLHWGNSRYHAPHPRLSNDAEGDGRIATFERLESRHIQSHEADLWVQV